MYQYTDTARRYENLCLVGVLSLPYLTISFIDFYSSSGEKSFCYTFICEAKQPNTGNRYICLWYAYSMPTLLTFSMCKSFFRVSMALFPTSSYRHETYECWKSRPRHYFLGTALSRKLKYAMIRVTQVFNLIFPLPGAAKSSPLANIFELH